MRQSLILVVLAIIPALSFAQLTSDRPVVLSAWDLVAPTGIAHVENIAIGNRQKIHIVISANDGMAEVTLEGRTILYSDGYSMVFTTLASTPSAFVARVVVNAPNGASATAILALNRQTGETAFAGVAELMALLRRSRDVRIAASVLPVAAEQQVRRQAGESVPSTTAPIGHRVFKPAPNDCVTSGFQLVVSASVAAASCPELLPGCIGGVGGVLVNGYSLATGGCGPSYDNTIGWG